MPATPDATAMAESDTSAGAPYGVHTARYMAFFSMVGRTIAHMFFLAHTEEYLYHVSLGVR